MLIIFFALANAMMVGATNGTAIRIMPLGDSITWGDNDGGYRQTLYLNLTNAGLNVDFVGGLSWPSSPDPSFDTDHEGHPGYRADDIRDKVYNWLNSTPADIVLLHIGTNDISNEDENVAEVEDILNEIDRYENDYNPVTVFLARITLRTDDPALNETTKAFNNAVEAMALDRISNGDKIIMVDMENALMYPNNIADDVHPNADGYKKMADVWYNAIYNLAINKPVANFSASPVSGSEPLTVSFSDASTSWDGIDSWLWDFGDGITSIDQNPTHIYNEGIFTVSLTVTEADGDYDTETKQNYITVEPPPIYPPIANFDIQSSAKPAINEEISFIDQSSDIDGTITSWLWNFGDGTTSTTRNPTHKYQSMDTYTVTLTIQDDDEATSEKTKQITIYEVTPPATTHDYNGLWQTSDITITLAATDDNSGVAETYYKINEGSTQQLSIDGQPQITSEATNNTLEYWSIDNAGNEETHHTLQDIKLDKTPPTAHARAWPNNNTGSTQIFDENTMIHFDGSASSDNIKITRYVWTLEDGITQTFYGVNQSYIFETPGVYSVTLTVSDAAEHFSNDTITISVRDITPPYIKLENNATTPENAPIKFDATKSYDNTGILNYQWIFGDGKVENTTVPTVIHTYTAPSNYTVELIVTDINNNVNKTLIPIVVYSDIDGDLIPDHLDPDSDGDQIPNEWELRYGLDPLDPSDASNDSDGDGINNIEEYIRESDPKTYDFPALTLPIILVVAILSIICFATFYARKLKKRKK